jgi:hypothetical protein
MDEIERVTDHAPVIRVSDPAERLGLPPELVSRREVAATGGAKCTVCDRRVDEHVQRPVRFEDEDGNPVE